MLRRYVLAELNSLLPFVVGLVMAGVGVAVLQGAQSKTDVPFASSAEIEAAVARAAASDGAATRLLPDGVYQYFVVTRKQPGLAEIHRQLSDVTIIRSGRGVLRTGNALASQREVSPGEWRGDAVQDSIERQLGAGDLLVIPAGLAHQLAPIGNDPLVYVTVKVPSELDKVSR
jgi:mannose-6-phosphate isomerase-like protein (cupin superfamily)